MPDTSSYRGLKPANYPPPVYDEQTQKSNYQEFMVGQNPPPVKPIIIDGNERRYEETEVVEESLNLEEMEKELIAKALKKHNNRRKEAAVDLGISERTLYRKIKEYEIQ